MFLFVSFCVCCTRCLKKLQEQSHGNTASRWNLTGIPLFQVSRFDIVLCMYIENPPHLCVTHNLQNFRTEHELSYLLSYTGLFIPADKFTVKRRVTHTVVCCIGSVLVLLIQDAVKWKWLMHGPWKLIIATACLSSQLLLVFYIILYCPLSVVCMP